MKRLAKALKHYCRNRLTPFDTAIFQYCCPEREINRYHRKAFIECIKAWMKRIVLFNKWKSYTTGLEAGLLTCCMVIIAF